MSPRLCLPCIGRRGLSWVSGNCRGASEREITRVCRCMLLVSFKTKLARVRACTQAGCGANAAADVSRAASSPFSLPAKSISVGETPVHLAPAMGRKQPGTIERAAGCPRSIIYVWYCVEFRFGAATPLQEFSSDSTDGTAKQQRQQQCMAWHMARKGKAVGVLRFPGPLLQHPDPSLTIGSHHSHWARQPFRAPTPASEVYTVCQEVLRSGVRALLQREPAQQDRAPDSGSLLNLGRNRFGGGGGVLKLLHLGHRAPGHARSTGLFQPLPALCQPCSAAQAQHRGAQVPFFGARGEQRPALPDRASARGGALLS